MSSNSKDISFKSQIIDISQDPFIFIVNGKEYKCNKYGVNVSNVIRELRSKDSSIKEYVYNFDNHNDEFQDICNVFNFKQVPITIKNMKTLLKIAEDLQIDTIIDEINNVIQSYESLIQESEIIDDIFYWLYQIDVLTVESITNLIYDSIWAHTEENIQELVAIILQVVRTSYKLHPYLIELITSLDELKDEGNDLHLLIPFMVKKLLFSFHKSVLYCAFIYKLSKSGHISIEKVVDRICIIDKYLSTNDQSNQLVYEEKFEQNDHRNLMIWFFPELLNLKSLDYSEILNNLTVKEAKFIKFYFSSNNVENFIKMRDSGEPDNEITLAILHDDVDTLQKLISNYNLNIRNDTIPLNIFDIFDRNISKSYIDYAAQCGSIKVFKYLFLNHARIDETTLGFAIFGGNTEIVRIIEHQMNNNNNNNFDFHFYNRNKFNSYIMNVKSDYFYDLNIIENPILQSIMTHNYDLFSWIIDQKIEFKPNTFDVNLLVNFAVQNGNINSLIQLIDRRIFSINSQQKKFSDLILLAAKTGFYRLIQLLMKLNNSSNMIFIKNREDFEYSSIAFGNLSIFKLLINSQTIIYNYNKILEFAVQHEYLSIVKYIFETLYKPDKKKNISSLFQRATSLDSPNIFNYLIGQFSLIDLKSNFKFTLKNFQSLLKDSCSSDNFEIIQIMSDFISVNYPKADFSAHLINAAKFYNEKLCQYFVDKKFLLDETIILQNYEFFMFGTDKFIVSLINCFDQEMKENLTKYFLRDAIKKGNKSLVDCLLTSKDLLNNKSLFNAVESRNIDIVNKVLQFNDKPSFINQISKDGSALNISVSNNDTEIVQRLLKLAKINVNSYEQENGNTPLLTAIMNKNIDIAKTLIEYPQTNVNLKNNISQSALVIAVENKLDEIVSLLINNERFDYDESDLDYAFYISYGKIAEQLISVKGLDVNYKNESFLFETALYHSYLQSDLNKIEMIISHHSFDPIKSRIKELILCDFINKNTEFVMKHIDKFLYDVNASLKGVSLFTFCAKNSNFEILKEIIKNESFNPAKNDFIEVFDSFLLKISSNSDEDIENIIISLIEYDEKHNKYIGYNKNYLYLAARSKNEVILNDLKKIFENQPKENVKLSVLPSLKEPGILEKLKTMESNPFDPLFIASQSSGDIYNLIDCQSEDSFSLYCNEHCFIDFELEEQVTINGIYLMFEELNFIDLFDVLINEKQIEISAENLSDDELLISFDQIACKKLTFRIKDSAAFDHIHEYISLNGIELLSTEEKYYKGVFAALIENNESHDPHKCPVIITASNYDFSSFFLISGSHSISTFNQEDSWFQIEFTKSNVILDGFRLKRSKSNKLKVFKVIGTDDINKPIEKWSTLVEVNEQESNEFHIFDVFQFQQPSEPIKVVRIIQTESNWSCNFHLIIMHIDFFGKYL